MKTIYLSITLALISIQLHAQLFEWAEVIDQAQANEVAALSHDSSGNIYMTGIKGDDAFVPHNGTGYIVKTYSDGSEAWSHTFGENLIIGDMLVEGSTVYIVAQSTSDILVDGELVDSAETGAFMVIVRFNVNGDLIDVQQFPEYHGSFANMDSHNSTVVVQCSGTSNSGTFVLYMNSEDGVYEQHELPSEIDFNEVAYFNNMTYFTGETSFGEGLMLDNVNLPEPTNESLNYVLAFDNNFTAQWGYSVDAINGNDNQIVAGESGIYAYMQELSEGFNVNLLVTHLSENGTVLQEVNPPVFSTAISLYPDLALSDCHLAFFVQNNFDFTSHELILFNHDLSLADEKSIDGNSNQYSGQVTAFGSDVFVSHVHTDDLDLNGEVEIIDLLDDAFQFPYLAKVGVGIDCGDPVLEECSISNLEVFDFDCNADSSGNYSMIINANIIDPGNDFFDLFVNNEFVDFYSIADLPLTITGITPRDAEQDIIRICVNDNPDCCAVLEYNRPDCTNQCSISNLETFDFDCNADSSGNYSMIINANIIDPGNDFFDLFVNNEFVDFYSIADLPLTITGITPRDAEQDIVRICVNDNLDCCAVLEYNRPDCTNQCSISNLEAFDFDCNADSSGNYSMIINANIIDPGNDFFDLFVNNEFVDFYSIDALPLSIEGIVPRNADQDIVRICINDNPDCCAVLEYNRPNCLIDNINEIDQNWTMYPNPIQDLLHFNWSGASLIFNVDIMDASGRQVLILSLPENSINLSSLESGIYFLRVKLQNGLSKTYKIQKI